MATRPVVQQLACPNCGSPLKPNNPQSQMVVCAACHTHVKIGMGDPEVLARANRVPPPQKPVRVGQIGTFKDVECIVLGRIAYRGWDNNDASDTWYWDEWLLGAKDGRMFWLSYYKEDGFILWHKMRIKEQFDTFSVRQLPIGNGKIAHVRERYPAAVQGAEGELTKQVKPNEMLRVVEAAGDGKRYSVQANAQELEMYEGIPMDEKAVAAAFKNDQWAKTAGRQMATQGILSFAAMAFLVFGVFGLILAAAMWSSGQVAYEETVQLSQTNPVAVIPIDVNTRRPLQISLEVENELPTNSYAEVDLTVVDPQDQEIYLYTKEFWHETGVDSEGSWTEKDYDTSRRYMPSSTGPHEIEIELSEISTNVQTVDVHVKVRKNHVVASWLLGYGIITVVLGFVFLGMSAPQATGDFFTSLFDD